MSKVNHDDPETTPEVKPVMRRPRTRSVELDPRVKRGPAAHPAPNKAEVHRAPQNHQPPPSQVEIARRAYEIWLQRGGGSGLEAEDWAQAERELSVSLVVQGRTTGASGEEGDGGPLPMGS
jgi:hypothetical protein